MTSTHAHTAQTGRHARGRAAAVRHRPRVGPRPRRVRRRPAAVRAPAAVRRHLRHADAVAAAAGRTDAPLGRLGRPGHARPRDRRPRPGRAPAAGAGEPHQPLPRAHHQPRREAAADRSSTTVPPTTDETPDEAEGGGRRSAATRTTAATGTSCGQGHGCGQGGRRSAAQPKARDRESSSPHPSTPPPRRARDRGRRRRSRRPIEATRCSPGAASPTSPRSPSAAKPPGRRSACPRPGGRARVCSPRSSWRCCAAGHPSRSSPPCSPSLRTGRRGRRCGWPKPDRGGTNPHPHRPSSTGSTSPRWRPSSTTSPNTAPPCKPRPGHELAAEHLPVTRATVTARAVQILHRSRQDVA